MQDEGRGGGRWLGNPCGVTEKRDEGSCVGKMSPTPCFLGESHHQHFLSNDGEDTLGWALGGRSAHHHQHRITKVR